MALDANILKKINQDIAVAQNNAAGLMAAIARRDAYLAQEGQGANLQVVIKHNDYDDYPEQDKENADLYISKSEEKNADKVENDVKVVKDAFVRIVEVFDNHKKAMDAINTKHNIYSKDPEVLAVQKQLETEEVCYVMSREESEAFDKINKVVDDVVTPILPQQPVVQKHMHRSFKQAAINPSAVTHEYLADVKDEAAALALVVKSLFSSLKSELNPQQQKTLVTLLGPEFAEVFRNSAVREFSPTALKFSPMQYKKPVDEDEIGYKMPAMNPQRSLVR